MTTPAAAVSIGVLLPILLLAAKQASVTLDVKDEDIHIILKDMQRQCGVRNLVIDRGVAGQGTFLFRAVPCRQAFDVVARTMDLQVVEQESSVVTVAKRR